LPILKQKSTQSRAGLPIFQAHGTQDMVVPFALGEHTKAFLEQKQFDLEWHDYPMGHEVCAPQIHDISRWLQGVFS